MTPAAVPEFLPALVELARMQHFAHAANLHETVWKQLPAIAENVGKKVGSSGRSRACWARCRLPPHPLGALVLPTYSSAGMTCSLPLGPPPAHPLQLSLRPLLLYR